MTDEMERLPRFIQTAAAQLHDVNGHLRWEGNKPTSEPFSWVTNCQHGDCKAVREAWLPGLAQLEADAKALRELDRRLDAAAEHVPISDLPGVMSAIFLDWGAARASAKIGVALEGHRRWAANKGKEDTR